MKRVNMSHVLVALVVLLASGVSTAVAAKQITSKQIKNGTIKLKDISTKAQESLVGAGAPGTNGTPGSDGAPGPALFLATMGYNSSGGGDTYSTPGAGNNTGTENTSQAPVPQGGAFTAKQFNATLTGTVPAGGSVQIALRVDGANLISCTVPAGQDSCSSPTEAVVPEGALISMRTLSTDAGPDFFGTAGYSFRGEF